MKTRVVENSVRAFFIVLFTVTFLSFLIANSLLQKKNHKGNEINVSEEVFFQLNEDEAKKVNLEEFSFQIAEVGDTITLTKVLPNIKVVQPLMILNIYHSTVEVYLGGEKIFRYGQELYEQGTVLGHEYFRIPISENYAGKELKVKLTITEKESYSSIEPIYIINSSDCYLNIISEHFLTLMAALTLITIGVVGLFASLSRKRYDRDTRTLTWISWFAIEMSVWMLCNDCVIYLFVPNFQIASVLEYYGVYVAVIPVSLFFANIQNNKWYRWGFLGYAAIVAIAVFALTMVHIFGGIHYIFWVPYIQIIMITLIAFIIYTLFRSFGRNETNQKILAYGMFFMGFVILLELVRFNMYKYFKDFFSIKISLVPIGTLIFVFSMVYSYCIKTLERYYDKAEQELLEKLAYMDVLTNTYNRNKCERILEEMEEKRESGYLINFDLNGLKFINDNYGHDQGDILLKNFSSILRSTFQGRGVVGRMGGDEFLGVVYETQEEKVVGILMDLDRNIALWNHSHGEEKVSVSYGYAYYSGGKHEKICDIYKKADENMYEFKKEFKKREGIPSR